MAHYKIIDVATWPRRSTFEFYRTFVNPSYSITVLSEIEPLYRWAKGQGESFFLLTLYAILRAANEIPQLRQRYVNEQVIEYDALATLTPIMTDKEEFRQVWCDFKPDFLQFKSSVEPRIQAAKKSQPGPMLDHGEDYLCISCLPWLHFVGATQAELRFEQTVPILAWGKMKDGKIPINGRFNHYFIDGLHFSRFFNKLEKYFLEPERLYRALD